MKDGIENSLDMSLKEYLPLLQRRIIRRTSYFGVKTLKNPMDFWVYQEIIYEMKPDVIVEVGNNWGGSTLALAHLLDLCARGRIIALDIDQSKVADKVRQHPRIKLFEGDAVACFDQVRNAIASEDRVLIIEDSSHTFENTLAVLRTYSPLTKPGDYFIVEDSICHHGLDVGPNPGPYEAIEAFILENDEFEVDRDKESFLITWNPKGFIKRKAQ
ncbi:CmcI family methyltransferase [Synechococcus sp. PCC 7336]|uniref:CmcI family methyltransferase n=1 Tax=Synechococcus sp. PCC 7336 TaxID=195250 RepID=UPI00047597BD|nr:CmcI family methyltransferase [Synechococcus sp. PCC 7336]